MAFFVLHSADAIVDDTRLPLWSSPPQSVQAFVNGVQASLVRLMQTPCPGLMIRADEGGYIVKWTLRIIGLTAVYAKSGSFNWRSTDMPILEFARAFPDQGAWIVRLARSMACGTLGDFTKALAYGGPGALLSMYLCLFADAYLDYFTNDFLDQHISALRKCLEQYRKKHGQNPHPAVLLQEFSVNVLGWKQLGG